MAGVRKEVPPAAREVRGMRTNEVILLTGLTYRQIDYYDHKDVVNPSIDPGTGSGSHRRYSEIDVVALRVCAYLRSIEMPLDRIKEVVKYVRSTAPWPNCRHLAITNEDIGWCAPKTRLEEVAGTLCVILDMKDLWLPKA